MRENVASYWQSIALYYQRRVQSFNSDKTFRRLVSNSSWLLGANGISAILSFITGILMARALGAEQYGVLALVTSFTSVANQVFDSRSWEVGIKFVTQFWNKGDERRALAVIKLGYFVDIFTALLAFLLVWFSADWGAQSFLGDTTYATFIRINALGLLFGWSSGTAVLLRVFDHFDVSAKISAFFSLLRLLVIVLVLYILHGNLEMLLWAYAAIALLTLLVNLTVTTILSRRHFHHNMLFVSLGCLRGYGKEIGEFMLSTNVTALLKIVQTNGAVLALGWWSSTTQAGYFKVASSIANNLSLLYGPIFYAVYPEFSHLWQGNKVKEMRALAKKLTFLPMAIGFACTVFAILLGNTLIPLLFGEQYAPTLGALIILFVAQTITACTVWIGPYLLASSHANWRTFSMFVASMIMLVGLVCGVPSGGSVGAASSVLLFYLGQGAIGLYYVWRVPMAHYNAVTPG